MSHAEDLKIIPSDDYKGGEAMISDVLSRAISDIDFYLAAYKDVYTGDTRKKIIDMRDAMKLLLSELDIPSRQEED